MSAVSAPKWVVYGFAAALILAGLVARTILFPEVDGGSVYLFLLPVVLVVECPWRPRSGAALRPA